MATDCRDVSLSLSIDGVVIPLKSLEFTIGKAARKYVWCPMVGIGDTLEGEAVLDEEAVEVLLGKSKEVDSDSGD